MIEGGRREAAALLTAALNRKRSTYWYDGLIYESDITRGLTIWRLDDPAIKGFRQQVFSNPQTQTFSIH